MRALCERGGENGTVAAFSESRSTSSLRSSDHRVRVSRSLRVVHILLVAVNKSTLISSHISSVLGLVFDSYTGLG
ncbi:uncharacterized [Tachysurus ichikawai]